VEELPISVSEKQHPLSLLHSILKESIMTTDLTKISGIGANSAKALTEAGFDTIEAIAKTTPAALGKVSGFGPKRAERVIASAKELTQDAKPAAAKPTPVVAPAVAAKQTTRVARFGRTRTFFASAAVLLLLVAAVLYFGYQNGIGGFSPVQTAQQDTSSAPDSQGAMMPGQRPMHLAGMPGNPAMAGQRTAMQGQQPMGNAGMTESGAMPAMQRHPNEPEWVARRRAQSEAQAQMHRARSEKIREESWNRYVASLPPAQAAQVTRQHEMAMRQMEESQRRQAAMIQQHNAYINQRYGNQRFGG
jgi:hypothetical protein